MALWAASQAIWAFMSALYLQHVLGYSAMQTGLAFFPAVFTMGLLSLGPVRNVVAKLGSRLPFATGLLLVTFGLVLLTRNSAFLTGVFPGMLLVGFGSGLAYNSFLLLALSGVREGDHGVASGTLISTGVMAGATGVALTASLATHRANELINAGAPPLFAFSSGYHLAFGIAALFAGTAAFIGITMLRYR
jgi:hypothetical protein